VSVPQFVVERITLGVYHDVWNAWKTQTGQPSNQFTAFWGELLEAYVDSLFLPIFPHSGRFKRLWMDEEIRYDDGSRPSDVLLDCGEVLVLVEVTHSRFTRQSLVAGDGTYAVRASRASVTGWAGLSIPCSTQFCRGPYSG
jgi:hypothetical protein